MQDMTVGSPRTHLWRHALPLLLGNWLQLSYNAVDTIIAWACVFGWSCILLFEVPYYFITCRRRRLTP